ncbi:S41 family peptidase [Cystobacter fuscus]
MEEVTLECESPRGRGRTVRLDWHVAGASWLARHFEDRPAMRDGLSARTVKTSHGSFGYMRVSSLHGSPETFLNSFVQALESMPREGLILDMRSCEEGFVQLGERLLQLFTPRRIQPERFQFRVTELILRMVRSCTALSNWSEAVERAAARGQVFSESLPLTSEEEANSMGQRYHGPVVLLTNALTYSTAEMFAAGFQDHRIGPVVGTAPRTGVAVPLHGRRAPFSSSPDMRHSAPNQMLPHSGSPSGDARECMKWQAFSSKELALHLTCCTCRRRVTFSTMTMNSWRRPGVS